MIFKNDFRTPRERVRGYGNTSYPEYLMPVSERKMINTNRNVNTKIHSDYGNGRYISFDGEAKAKGNDMKKTDDSKARLFTGAFSEKSDSVTSAFPLAMVYSPNQSFEDLFDEEEAFVQGSLFRELTFPFKCSGCPDFIHGTEEIK